MNGLASPPAPAAVTVGTAVASATAQLAAAGLPTPRVDAELLLAHVLRTPRVRLQVEPGAALARAAAAALAALVARRCRHEPLQYLVGAAEFCGLGLALGPGVFVPRPETEELVRHALAGGPRGPALAIDLGTGSGAIACALAAARPAWTVWATEASPVAAACARDNARRLGLADRVRVVPGDLDGPLAGLAGQADLVVANPPYLPSAILPDLPAEVREWEPRLALDGGPDGLTVIRRVLAAAPGLLRPGGLLLVEIGEEQGPSVRRLVAAGARYGPATVHRDFRGVDRVLETRRSG
jgi:release factor glutamine methyltransferase